MQIDFGDTRVWIGGERLRVHLFVGTLGYSRRVHIRPSLRERQADWFDGMEGVFLRFSGVAAEVLLDNARALVEHHDAVTREVRFNARLHAFARYRGFTRVVADHCQCQGRRQRIVDRAHFVGVAGAEGPVRAAAPIEIAPSALLRPLAEYEAVVGGGW